MIMTMIVIIITIIIAIEEKFIAKFLRMASSHYILNESKKYRKL